MSTAARLVPAGAGLVALAAAVAMRVQVAGNAGAQSVPAGVLFGVLLLLAAAAYGRARLPVTAAHLGWGLGGSVVLCLPAALGRVGRPTPAMPLDGVFLRWAAVVTLVALAEELLLRGALYDAVRLRHGEPSALILTTVAFAALHVPVYGWHVALLDLAAGFLLGALRAGSGAATAPVLAHVTADLATWWLR